MNIHILPALEDNYIYVIRWDRECAVVDPSVAEPVLKYLEQHKVSLKYILNTHHHYDHVGGNEQLKKLTHCQVIGPNDPRIPSLDRPVHEGGQIEIGPYTFKIIKTPGHTTSHILYHEPEQKWLFCGDTLFGCGCGRLFEGSPSEMFHSMHKILELPSDTSIYFGHEYTLKNLEFAISLEPDNLELHNYYKRIQSLIKQGRFAVPSTVENERKFNPFLRMDDPKLKKALQMENNTDLDVFTVLREKRDEF